MDWLDEGRVPGWFVGRVHSQLHGFGEDDLVNEIADHCVQQGLQLLIQHVYLFYKSCIDKRKGPTSLLHP